MGPQLCYLAALTESMRDEAALGFGIVRHEVLSMLEALTGIIQRALRLPLSEPSITNAYQASFRSTPFPSEHPMINCCSSSRSSADVRRAS